MGFHMCSQITSQCKFFVTQFTGMRFITYEKWTRTRKKKVYKWKGVIYRFILINFSCPNLKTGLWKWQIFVFKFSKLVDCEFYLPVCKKRWFLRFVCFEKPLEQMWHLNGHEPLCTYICDFKSPGVGKDFEQRLHLCGFSYMTIR